MSLNERLGQEIKAAMLARNTERLGTLRLLKSATGYAAIEKKRDALEDADFVALVQKEVRKRQDSAEQFEKGGRPELAVKERAEILVLEEFLPPMLSAAELEEMIRGVIAELGATSRKDMGAVMKAVQARAGGRADGRTLSGVVARLLP